MGTPTRVVQSRVRHLVLTTRVRPGLRVDVDCRCQPALDAGPLGPCGSDIDARVRLLEETGRLVPAHNAQPAGFRPVKVVPGALDQFLKGR